MLGQEQPARRPDGKRVSNTPRRRPQSVSGPGGGDRHLWWWHEIGGHVTPDDVDLMACRSQRGRLANDPGVTRQR